MEKRKYYVSVQSRTIMLNQGDASFELEIEASPEEIEKLQSLFEDKEDFDNASFYRSHYPGVPYHHDDVNDGYDMTLKEVYRTLYNLGTKETKDHIESMNILN